jgi:hypothetical protein
MQLSRLCKFAACFSLFQIFASELSDEDLVVESLFRDAITARAVNDLTGGSPQITYLAFPSFSLDGDDGMDGEDHRRFLWAAGKQRDIEVTIRLLQRSGGDDLLSEMLEAFYQNGRPESQVEPLFFLDHCNSCREQSSQNLLDFMVEVSDEAIVEEAIRLFELGLDHEINDVFLFMTEPLPVPRLVRRLRADMKLFAKTLFMSASNRLWMGAMRLLQMREAPLAVERLEQYNQAHGNEIEEELQYIAAIPRRDISFYDHMLLRLCAIYDLSV